MASETDEKALKLYIALMEELKGRALSINAMTNSRIGLGAPLIREYCFLQFRMICELIALGCLVAHGDITNLNYFQKHAYKADDIMKRLGKLHSDFFPVAVNPIFSPGRVHLELRTGDVLTKDELLRMYGTAGDVLHKGTLDRVMNQVFPKEDYSDIQMWGQRLLNLMSNHKITRVGGRFHFVTFLENKDYGRNVHSLIAEAL
jgi:hypothetical protein